MSDGKIFQILKQVQIGRRGACHSGRDEKFVDLTRQLRRGPLQEILLQLIGNHNRFIAITHHDALILKHAGNALGRETLE